MFQLCTCVTTRTTEMQHEIWGEIVNISVKVLIPVFWFGVLAHQLIRKMFCSALYCDIFTVYEMQKKLTGIFAVKERIKPVHL